MKRERMAGPVAGARRTWMKGTLINLVWMKVPFIDLLHRDAAVAR